MYPDNLLELPDVDVEESEQQWWALYTMSNREKDLMRRLRKMGIPHYAPIIEKVSRSPQGRKRKSYVPLFTNYVFLFGSNEARYQAKTTNCVSRDMEVPSPKQLVHDLRQVRQLIESGKSLTPEAKLQKGELVRVKSGALAGQEGVILERRGERRLLVAVNFLQQGASVLLEDFEVEKL